MRILVLTSRSWSAPRKEAPTDPLQEQVDRWREKGNEVTLLSGRIRAAWATLRGTCKDADVVLEVVDKEPLMAPLWWWIDAPQVTLVHHRDSGNRIYSGLRSLAIRLFYGHHEFMVVSRLARDELLESGVPPERVSNARLEPPEESDALAVLETAAEKERARLLDVLRQSQTGAAAGLAAATLANNAIQLIFTVIFTRLLGADGYGALAALISAFLILMVTGQSVQAAAAREATLGGFGDTARLRLTLQRWVMRLAILTIVLAAVSFALRDQLASLFGVDEHPWAATAVLPAGSLWMLISLQRGALQGLHAYAPVGYSLIGEAGGRVICGLILVGLGASVTGAFLGTPMAFAITAVYLGWELSKRLGPPPAQERTQTRRLRTLIADNRVPIFGLLLLALLQNVDVIVARHEFDGDAAGSYAATAVAAKAMVWVAIGVGLQVLPEATRRAADGDDPRPVLLRALGVLAVIATPALILFALVPKLLLRIAFSEELTIASGALPLLGVAMTLLAIAYLSVQYMFALGETRFIWVLLVVAAVEPLILMKGNFGLTDYALVVLGLQAVVATLIFTLGMTTRERHGPAPAGAEVA